MFHIFPFYCRETPCSSLSCCTTDSVSKYRLVIHKAPLCEDMMTCLADNHYAVYKHELTTNVGQSIKLNEKNFIQATTYGLLYRFKKQGSANKHHCYFGYLYIINNALN